MTVFVTWVVF